MNGVDGHAAAGIDSGDPAADAGDKLIVKAVGGSGDLLHGDPLLAVAAHQHHLIVDADIRNAGDIHHHLIHADPAQDGGLFAPDQNMEFSGQVPAVAVGIAHGDGGHGGGTGGGIGAAIADLPAGRQGFHMGDTAEPGQGRLQLQQIGRNLAAGIQAVGDDAGAHHFIMAVKIHQAGGVVQVADGDGNAPAFQHLTEPVKLLGLGFGPGQVGAVGGGKMAENALGMKAGQVGDSRAQVRLCFRHLKADAAHAGVHGEMEMGRQADGLGGSGQGQGILPAVDGGTDILHNSGGEGLYGGVAQDQNGGPQAGPPQFHGFQHGADAEKGALLFQKPGDGDGTVAIGIGLDDRHDGNTGFLGNGIKIPGNGIQVDPHPGVVEIQENQLTYT